jgi:hypothetical protein
MHAETRDRSKFLIRMTLEKPRQEVCDEGKYPMIFELQRVLKRKKDNKMYYI